MWRRRMCAWEREKARETTERKEKKKKKKKKKEPTRSEEEVAAGSRDAQKEWATFGMSEQVIVYIL